jgi:arsenite methyltransferase
MSQLAFDGGTAARLELLYRTRDVLRRRRLVYQALGAREGERILDVGCGPGFYVSELLDQVGPEGSVVGVDRSTDMLSIAAARCEGRDTVAFHEAEATALPLPDGACDAAISVQVLEYVPDHRAALAELHRLVRPGGRVVLWDVDWSTVSWHSEDPARMDRVLAAWDGHLAHRCLPRVLAGSLGGAGFTDVHMEGHTFATAELTPDAYGGAIIPVILDYVSGVDGVGPGEAEAWVAEQRDLDRRGAFFFTCTQFCFAATRT